jgi:hypothetical protein
MEKLKAEAVELSESPLGGALLALIGSIYMDRYVYVYEYVDLC